MHLDGIFRQQFFHQFRPFDETECAAIEIILVAHVINFFQLLDAIEVEMVNQLAAFRTVFVDDGESGRVDDVFHAEAFAYGFDERGFAGSHVAVEGEDRAFAHGGDEFPCGFVDMFQIVYFDFQNDGGYAGTDPIYSVISYDEGITVNLPLSFGTITVKYNTVGAQNGFGSYDLTRPDGTTVTGIEASMIGVDPV